MCVDCIVVKFFSFFILLNLKPLKKRKKMVPKHSVAFILLSFL